MLEIRKVARRTKSCSKSEKLLKSCRATSGQPYTLDPSVLNQITLAETKKYVRDPDKEMAVVQRALLNTTGPL